MAKAAKKTTKTKSKITRAQKPVDLRVAFLKTIRKHLRDPANMMPFAQGFADANPGLMTRVFLRGILGGIPASYRPPYNLGKIDCDSVASFGDDLLRHLNASQRKHDAEKMAADARQKEAWITALRTDNGLPACPICTQNKGFPCFSLVRDTGHAAASNGGKSNNTKCHCTLYPCGYTTHA
jgi:hypothetical protein